MQPQYASIYASTPFTRPIRRRTRCLRVPVETVLTPLVLTSAARRLPNAELEAMIDTLIAETDARAGDMDLEDDANLELDYI